MCGIFCCICGGGNDKTFPNVADLLLVHNRGPDGTSSYIYTNSICKVLFVGSVLHLRGSQSTIQPLLNENETTCLLWNGELFAGYSLPSDANDTQFLSQLLNSATDSNEIISILSKIHGPWALIYFQKDKQLLWFGRDLFGRRSLLWKLPKSSSDAFMLSSVAVGDLEHWQEVPATGLFCLDMKTLTDSTVHLKHYCWSEENTSIDLCPVPEYVAIEKAGYVPSPLKVLFNKELPSEEDLSQSSEQLQIAAKQLIDILGNAVKLRVTLLPPECHVCKRRKCNSHAKVGVLFSGGVDSCVLAALADRFVPLEQPIDLLNVAFEPSVCSTNRKNRHSKRDDKHVLYNVPDRIIGKQSLEELKKANPRRKWNFIEIDVSVEELQRERTRIIRSLIAPCNSVLDDSIGCAVWFAAKGKGMLQEGDDLVEYTSPTKMVLVGMGADEQLAGYSRHRIRFQQGGWPALLEELELDIKRISQRNLGRDDRVISDHGRESRLPFLDEEVVTFLNSLPIWIKANLHLPRGVGEKIVLRNAAKELGLMQASMAAKRAIQFGSRIAKAECRNEKGSDVCLRLT